jgi:hypothetical protein
VSIQEFVQNQVVKGRNNAQIAAAAMKKFPEMKSTNSKYVAWYRWNMKRNGAKKVPASKKK